jgi:hypothetical protein
MEKKDLVAIVDGYNKFELVFDYFSRVGWPVDGEIDLFKTMTDGLNSMSPVLIAAGAKWSTDEKGVLTGLKVD